MPATSALRALEDLTPTISVGILTADLLSLGSEISLLEQAGVSLVHFDVMDGCFTPAMTVGPPLIAAVKTPLIKDVHLMIQNPLVKIEDYLAAGADIITVHVEASPHVHRVLQQMGNMSNPNNPELGLIRGVALNPGTPVDVIEPLLEELEIVLILAVNPGWGGQKFIEASRRRLARARQMIQDSGREILLAVDGGIRRDNIAEIAAMEVDIVVTGSAVFDGKAPAENARFMLDALRARKK
jgi:ribulose-phosphate 3-epimerase